MNSDSFSQASLFSRSAYLIIVIVLLPAVARSWTPPSAVDLNTTTARRFDTILSAAAGTAQTRGVVWSSNSETTDSENGLFFSRSLDGGASWSPRQDLIGISSLPFGSWGDRPCLATDVDQTWVIGWDACQVVGNSIQGDRDVYFLRSTNAGQTWSSPAILNSNAADPLIRNYKVSIASDRLGVWAAGWETDVKPSPGARVNSLISIARSADNAQTWAPVQFLDPSTSTTLNENPHIATNGQGTWITAWDSTGTTDTDIRYCRSTDNGITWSASDWLNTTALTDHAEGQNVYDGNVRLAANASGVWIAVWTSAYDAGTTAPVKERIVFSRSLNDGVTWSSPSPVDPSVDPGRPVRQLADIVWAGPPFAVLWSGPGGLEASSSWDNGATWTAPVSVASGTGYEGGPESRPRLAAGSGGLRLGAWARRPAGSSGPDIISAADQDQAGVAEWQLIW